MRARDCYIEVGSNGGPNGPLAAKISVIFLFNDGGEAAAGYQN